MIRKYCEADLPELLDVWHEASLVAHPFLDEAFLASERRNIPELYLPNAETCVYEHEGRVVGFIAMIGNEVGAIFVQPRLHGQGIGQALMNYVRERRDGLEVQVFKRNRIGRRFYSRYGFEEVSESIHEASGHEVILMKLEE
jgi:putative acetyltransferase